MLPVCDKPYHMNNEIQQKCEEFKNLRNYALSFTSDTCEEAVAFRVKRLVQQCIQLTFVFAKVCEQSRTFGNTCD